MPKYFTCTVDGAGVSVEPVTDTPANPVYLYLTDSGGTFQKQQFYATDSARREMLAVGLAAISTQNQVRALLDPPDPANDRIPLQCYELTVAVD